MVPTINAAALGMALRRIAEVVTEALPASIRVATAQLDPRPLYVVSIPTEYRAELCHHLAQYLDLAFPPDGGPLIVTFEQAREVIELAYRRDGDELAPATAAVVTN